MVEEEKVAKNLIFPLVVPKIPHSLGPMARPLLFYLASSEHILRVPQPRETSSLCTSCMCLIVAITVYMCGASQWDYKLWRRPLCLNPFKQFPLLRQEQY
jgi:hypothetical protein